MGCNPMNDTKIDVGTHAVFSHGCVRGSSYTRALDQRQLVIGINTSKYL